MIKNIILFVQVIVGTYMQFLNVFARFPGVVYDLKKLWILPIGESWQLFDGKKNKFKENGSQSLLWGILNIHNLSGC